MTPGDAARVLTKAAAFDQRTIGEGDVLAWHEAVGDLDTADALTAVSRFYATVVERRLMPGDVRALAGEVERERIREQRAAIAAASPHPIDARPLTDRSAEIQAFVNGVRGALPDSDPDVLHPRQAQWRREYAIHHERPDAQPNPDFNPAMAKPVDWERSKAPPKGCWWEDDSARERHAIEELAKAGRLRIEEPA